MKIFDTHAHYDDEKFDKDRDEIIQSLKKANIVNCINIGCDITTSKKALELANTYDFIYAAIGIHPSELAEFKEKVDSQINQIKKIYDDKKVVAIGEIGLDYHWKSDNKDLQKYAFIQQIALANELGLPISIHTRDAIDDTIGIIREFSVLNGGVIHCCPFNRELVKHGLDAGLHIAFGGTCTFKNSKNADEIINMVPIEKMLIETDSPYLAPDPLRGTRNDSRNLIYVIQKLASVKGMSPEKIATATYENAKKLFSINT